MIDSPLVTDKAGFERKFESGLEKAELLKVYRLKPTPYFFEALPYWDRASKLQDANLAGLKTECGDDLQDHIPIYDTVQRRYAGFSNVLEQLFYGKAAPKYERNKRAGRATEAPFSGSFADWLYICLVHRVTGSGASFESDHGWRNTIVPEMASLGSIDKMKQFTLLHPGPMFTSIGNQIPAFNKKTMIQARTAGQEYLFEIGPKIVDDTLRWLENKRKERGKAAGITETVDFTLDRQTHYGVKRFAFVLTAWVMDIAQYEPHLVDPNSDCYHGANAIKSLTACFEPMKGVTKSEFFNLGTRFFSDITGTFPMDVEDVSPGCDLIRWLENYVPKWGFDHVHHNEIYNSSSLFYPDGRQPHNTQPSKASQIDSFFD